MNESVLVNADIDECAEVDNVSYSTLELHSDLEILKTHDIGAEKGSGKLISGVTAGSLELGNNVLKRGKTDSKLLCKSALADSLDSFVKIGDLSESKLSLGISASCDKSLCGVVAFGVTRGVIKNVGAFGIS